MRLKFIKKSQSKISHHEILFIRKFRGNIGKIKNYDYEKKITKTSKSNKYLWTYGEHMKIRGTIPLFGTFW